MLDSLKEGIGLRGIGQKNPLIEYKKEAFETFMQMMNAIKTEVVGRVLHLNANIYSAEQIRALEKSRQAELAAAKESGPSDSVEQQKPQTQRREIPKIGRNDVCTCGSGKKYKVCCGKR